MKLAIKRTKDGTVITIPDIERRKQFTERMGHTHFGGTQDCLTYPGDKPSDIEWLRLRFITDPETLSRLNCGEEMTFDFSVDAASLLLNCRLRGASKTLPVVHGLNHPD